MFSKEKLNQVVKGLPQLPEGVAIALQLIEKGDVDIVDISNALKANISITTYLLKVANSPFYGFSKEISSIKEACMIIGLKSVRNILIASSIAKQFPTSTGNCIPLNELWLHSIGTAAAAKIIASMTNQDEEISFMAGMLHEIGNMILDTYYPNELARVIEHQKQNGCFLRKSQVEILGIAHSDIAIELMNLWKFPNEIKKAVHYYSQPKEESGRSADILHIANIISKSLFLGQIGDSFIPQLNEGSLQRLNIEIKTITKQFEKIETLTLEASNTLLSY